MHKEPRQLVKKRLLRLVRCALLTAVAMLLSYLEAILPFSIGIPGVKIGFSHIVTVFSLYTLSPLHAFGITLTRVLLSACLFGNLPSLLYSLSGALLSLGVMLLLSRFTSKKKLPSKTPALSPVGVSLCGGVAHNIGQMLCAILLTETAALWWYLPTLLVAGCIAGALIGVVAGIAVKRVQVHLEKPNM